MKNLLPRVTWDYLVGAVVGVSMALVALIVGGFVLGVVLRGAVHPFAGGRLIFVGVLTFLAVLLAVTLYEALLRYRARGKMLEPGSTESRLLTREVLVRAALKRRGGRTLHGPRHRPLCPPSARQC